MSVVQRVTPRCYGLHALLGTALMLAWAGAASAFDVDDGYAPTLDGAVNALAVQPSGHGIVGGEFTNVNGSSCARLCRLDAAGRVAAGFGPTGLNGDVFALLVEPDGAVTVGGAFTQGFGQPRARLLRVNTDGSIDGTAGDSVNGTVRALARQPDGRLLIGGDFSQIGGSWPSRRLARQLASGAVDTSFLAEVDGSVLAIAWLDDGRIVIGGTFANVSGVARQNLAVLLPSGQVDFNVAYNANGAVRSITRDNDGTLIIGGAFTQIGGIARSRLARMTPDGELVYGLATAEAAVRATLVHSDGQLILGGDFLAIDNQPRARLSRLDQERQLESTWRAVTGGSVNAIAEQPDGSLLVGGSFTTANGEPRSRLARVTPQGQLERTLIANANPGGAVLSSASLADGRMVLGGNFTSIAGQPRERLARLRSDGTLDPDFTPTANGNVRTVAVLDDGGMLLTGSFTQINGNPRPGLAKLLANGSLDNGFSPPSFDGPVSDLFLTDRSEIYVVGDFDRVGSSTRAGVARLRLGNGALDPGFEANVRFGARQVIQQPDGRVLVVGASSVDVLPQPARLTRLTATGRLDPTFNPQVGEGNEVTQAALQPDGRIIVALRQAAVSSSFVRRLNADGSLDAGFTAVTNGPITSIALRTDGVIAIAGEFNTAFGVARNGYALLRGDTGSLDTGPLPGADGTVLGARFQSDGKLVLTGSFSSVDGQARAGLARLSTPVAARYALEITGPIVRWLRSGAAPELTVVPRLWGANFGQAPEPRRRFVRTTGGWQVDATSLLQGASLVRVQPRSIEHARDGAGATAREYQVQNVFLFADGFEPGDPN